MIKSISTWAFQPQRPADEIFDLCRQHGFDGLEISLNEEDDLAAISRAMDAILEAK